MTEQASGGTPLPPGKPATPGSIGLWAVLGAAIVSAAIAAAWTISQRSAPPRDRSVTPPVSSTAGPGGGEGAASAAESGGSSGTSVPVVGLNPSGEAEKAPDFTLTDQTGRAVALSDLRGKVWIADFIFTRCTTVCPTLTRTMAQIRTELAKRGAADVRTVSFSVDPAFDTPAVLKEYAAGFRADPQAWSFLTGDPAAVVTTVRDGFHLMMNDPGEGAPMHSNRIILVDAEGRMRSSHLGTDDGIVDTVVKDALALHQEARGAVGGTTR